MDRKWCYINQSADRHNIKLMHIMKFVSMPTTTQVEAMSCNRILQVAFRIYRLLPLGQERTIGGSNV